ncbi:ty3-gypsy retrotransposon protein [Tanacetum coccineum]
MGGGDSGSALPRAMRLDVPKFNGTDPDSWIFSITEYFTLLNTPVDQRLKVVGFNLEGEAAEWFRWMTRNNLITDWDRFVESVRNRFGPSKYEDPQGTLSKLLQTVDFASGASGTPQQGLCFNCDNKWACGHKFPGKFILLMAEDGDGTGQDMEADATDAVESGDISILNSLIGHGSRRSLQL